MNRLRGVVASVLVDINLLSDLPNQILVERSRFAFIADLEYEKLFPFLFFLQDDWP